MSDLYQEPERDEFKNESPIRAFTTWSAQGRYALGKGFRPSLQHLVPYLHAMEAKEGWRLVQVLEAATGSPSFIFRQSYVVPDDVLIERLKGDDALKQEVRDMLFPVMPELTFTARSKITLDDVDAFLKEQGLALVREQDGCARMYKVEGDRASTFSIEYATRGEDGTVTITRTAFDAMPEWLLDALPNFGIEEPYVRNREGFEEAGRKIDQARDMAADMERTEINGHLAFVFRGLDSETTFWNRARWNGKPEEAMKAMASMKPVVLAEFLEMHNVESVAHFWRSASVAAVLRLIDKLDWWDRVSLADPITHDELAKALGHTPPASAIAAMSADPYKAVADFIRDQPLGETYEPKEHRVDLRKHKVDDVRALAPEGYVFDRYEGHGDEFAVFVREVTSAPPVSAIGDDPINPKHYAGRECADIGERLSANGYQILKYCWRLGKKDDPCQELGKALWYGESERAYMVTMGSDLHWSQLRIEPTTRGIKDPAAFLEDRIADQPQFTQNIARMLWAGYNQRQLQAILEAINEHRFHLDCGRGLAI